MQEFAFLILNFVGVTIGTVTFRVADDSGLNVWTTGGPSSSAAAVAASGSIPKYELIVFPVIVGLLGAASGSSSW